MKDILEVNILEDLNSILYFNNINLLENPIIKENTTIFKIICNKYLKRSLKKIEKLLDNTIKFNINFDLNSEKDYYELIINKKINKIVNQLNINNSYNIGVKLLIEKKLWILQSIEISDFETFEEEDIVDYYEIKEDLLVKININSISINKQIEQLNLNLIKLNKFKNEIEKNFNKSEIENYYKFIN